ncbi:serine threonine-kinase [Micractinium conductrix]|uniref:Serine threonine-kinase n=1 Tax=Micractinium conductrix TaxID=554055 RepID=A0A2P6VKL2_9CHLO|nr:serine threonine-kinase [Micractinium conductrix]|eukprot:PSC74633.1 serine threonine-kinase [Micractinium conductrix]
MPAAASPASAAAAARPTVVSPPPMHVALVIPPQQARAPAQAAQLQQPPSPPAVPAQPMPGVIPAVAATLAAADPATQAAILAAIQQQQQQQQDAGLAAMQQQQAEQLAAQQQQQASLLAEQQQRAAAAAAAAEQQQAALLAAQHQAQQRQAQQEAASAAAAEAEQQQAALLAAQQQQDAAAAAAAAQREHNALLAVQQQQAALMAAQQQEQQTAMQAAQQQAAWAAAVADQQQQQALFEAQQQAALAAAAVDHRQQQALLLAQQQAGALLAAQQAAQQAAAAQQQAVAQAAVPPMQASVAPPAYLPVGYLPALPGYAPAPQLQQQLQLTPHVAALMQRQVSQALSGFSGGGSEAGPGQLPFFPSGEPPLRYSPSPQPLRHRSLHPMSAAEAVGMAVSPSAFAAAAAGQRRARVKAVVSSGGRFRPPALAGRASGAAAFLPSAPGSWLYEGGETRLVSLPDGCSLLELLAVLGSKQQRGLATAALLSPRVPSPAAQPPPAGRQPAAGAGRGSASLSAGITYYTPALGSPPGASQAPSTQGSGATAGDQGPAGFATPLQTPASLTGVAESVATSGLEAAAAAVAAAARSSSGLQKLCIVRYRLPSEPDMFVDIVDEEDVRLMFEEYHDWVEEGLPGSGGNTGGRKLHIFVEWAPLQAAGAGVSDASADFDLRPVGPPGALTPSDSSMEVPDQAPPAAPSPPPKLSDLTSTKIEVIPGDDVQLTALLGAGTFGDTYRGNWHESLVAVKCINPLMIGVQYASRQAWIDFLRDANQMGKLRHPSLCEVYGVVLPHDTDPRLAAPRSRSEPTAPATLPASVSAPAPAQQAQQALHTPLGLPGPLPVGLVAPPAGPPTPGSLPASAMPQFAGMLPAASQAEGGPRAGSPPASGAAGLMLQRESTLPVVAGTLPQALPGPVANPPATVMEFVGGKSLHNAIASRSDLVFSRLSRVVYALDTAKALSYLHSRRVAHLDIKSGNILLGWRDRRPSAKVVGYGLTGRKVSMVRCAAQGVTSAASMLPWTAPEVLRTPELVTGKASACGWPYEGQDPMELLTRIRQGEVVRPALPGTDEEPPAEEPGPGWRALLERCWAQDPEQRPDFAVVEEELRGIAREVKRQQPPGRPRPAIPLPRSGSRGTALRRAPSGAPPRRQNSGEAAAAATGVLPAAANRHGSGFLLARQAGSGVWAPEQPARVQAAAPASAPPGLPPPEHQRQEPPQQPERAPGQQEQEEHAARAALPQYEAQQEGSPLPETQAGAAAAGPAGHAPPEVAASS